MAKASKKYSIRKILFNTLLLIVASGLAYVAVAYLTPASPSFNDLKVGDVTAEDILAPHSISYTSKVLTDQMREAAIRGVAPRYTNADTNVARQQLEKIRAALAYISSVRADANASSEQKLADLAALENAQLSQQTGEGILSLNDARWQTVQQEAIVVLEQVMRSTIRDDQLDTARRSVPNLVSLALPEDQTAIVAELVAAFIAPNSFYSENLTEAARQEAANNVENVTVSFAAGETILNRGEVVSVVDIEALQNFGLVETENRWQDVTGAGVLVILSATLVVVYFQRKPKLAKSSRGLFLVTLVFIVFLVIARLILPVHPLAPYIYPLAAYALIISGLFGAEPALVTVIPLIILTTYGQANAFELTLYYGISSMFGVLFPRKEKRITAYIWVGLTVAASGAATITALRLPLTETSGVTLATISAITFLNGIITAGLTVLMQYLLAPIIGQITPLQLLELSRPDHPLLEYLLRSAPGTYQHSLQVANLAEQAAERINADSLLTRVGALYHDIGKTQNAQFFVENQVPGQVDTHEHLDPEESAQNIIQHVNDGIALGQKYRLPRRIQNFITEHHGTNKAKYQWTQAVKKANGDLSQLNEEFFKYGGPRPQSRETALVMLADGCEARVRAKSPSSEEELKVIIKESIDSCLSSGQLDETPLTLKDLKTINESFTATLRGIYHPRVEYPNLELDAPTRPIKGASKESYLVNGLPGLEIQPVTSEKPTSHD